MQRRKSLRSHLTKAWQDTIKYQYQKKLINSERGLQVYFCSALIKAFNGASRRIFVEPRILIGQKVCYPDIVICNTKRIIGVVELKYLPRAKNPYYKKDLNTLRGIAKYRGNITLSNDRYLGKGMNKKMSYPLANDAVLCWAGVYQAPKVNLSDKLKIGERFLVLHALTTSNGNPKVEVEPHELLTLSR